MRQAPLSRRASPPLLRLAALVLAAGALLLVLSGFAAVQSQSQSGDLQGSQPRLGSRIRAALEHNGKGKLGKLGKGKSSAAVVMVSNVAPQGLDRVVAEGVGAADSSNYITLTAVMNMLWAEAHGYAFRLVVHPSDGCMHPTLGRRVWWWCRLLEMQSAMDDLDVDWVLYLDADAFFPDPLSAADVDDLVARASRAGAGAPPAAGAAAGLGVAAGLAAAARLAAAGTGGPSRDEWWSGDWSRLVAEPSVILSKDVTGSAGVCAGVAAWRNSAEARQVLCDVWRSQIDVTVARIPSWMDDKHGIHRRAKDLQQGGMGEQPVMSALLLDVLRGHSDGDGEDDDRILENKHGERAMAQLRATDVADDVWLRSVAVVPASVLYLGDFVFHAALGSKAIAGKGTDANSDLRCGNSPDLKLRRCIEPAFTANAQHLVNDALIQRLKASVIQREVPTRLQYKYCI